MSVASKNLYELLGNDDGDSDTPGAPVKTVDKRSTHTTKRNGPADTPSSAPAGPSGNRRGALRGSDGAFRDRDNGSTRNRERGVPEEGSRGARRGGANARVRGGRGSAHPRDHNDRVPRHHAGSEKQAAQGWGAAEGKAELKDEQAGEEIATEEKKDAAAEGETAEGDAEGSKPAEPEEKKMTLEDYLALQAEKKLALKSSLEVRKPNEGSKIDKNWANAKEFHKEEEDYFAGGSSKAKRDRERKQKNLVEIDNRYHEPERQRGRGGARGAPRGQGSRGEFRGGRGRGSGGGRENNSLNMSDERAFPSLGS